MKLKFHRPALMFACCGLLLAGSASAQASSQASDTASNPAYAGGWLNGTNGGTGFGAWTFANTRGGHHQQRQRR